MAGTQSQMKVTREGRKLGMVYKMDGFIARIFFLRKFSECFLYFHRGPAQSVWVADCYFIVNVLDLPFASPIAIYR